MRIRRCAEVFRFADRFGRGSDDPGGLDNVVVGTSGSIADICTVDQICPSRDQLPVGHGGTTGSIRTAFRTVANGFVQAGLITKDEAHQISEMAIALSASIGNCFFSGGPHKILTAYFFLCLGTERHAGTLTWHICVWFK